ncbi:MAG: patatin-like phospholipase family protein [Gemmatimonadaceae bacterium]
MALYAPLDCSDLALVLGGGGARSAYQVGVLRAIARRYPDLTFPILTGVSAGGVNTAHIASSRAPLLATLDDLVRLWLSLTPDQVYRVDPWTLSRNAARWGWRLFAGGLGQAERIRALVDTSPLKEFLGRALVLDDDGTMPGIEANLKNGRLSAVALSATSYTTAQSVTWVQGGTIEMWERPQRKSVRTRLTLDHVMASTALPLLFPAVRVGREWFGDGGIRLTAPLSPALHLGASRILTISTRYDRSRLEADQPQVPGYPPPAQVLGVLYNAVFLDLIDQDVARLELMNRLLERLPEAQRGSLRVVDILVIRPSRDLGKLAHEYEPRLPKGFRFLTRGLGTRRTTSPDILSLVMFQEDYLKRLIELGETDADAHAERIDNFIAERRERTAA